MSLRTDRIGFAVAAAAAIVLTPTGSSAQALTTRHSLGAEAAKAAVAGCETYARQHGWAMAIAVIDATGEPLAFLRMDGSPQISIDFANGKAKAAQRMGAPSDMLIDRLAKGDSQVLNWGLLPSKGGLPIIVDGETVGAVGTSGVAQGRDVECTRAAVEAAQALIARDGKTLAR